MRMKIFTSPQRDLEKNFSYIEEKLLIIQKQLRDLRDDNQDTKKRLIQLARLMTVQTIPEEEEDLPTEELEAR